MIPHLKVIEAGIGVTLQDAGRPGYGHFGLPVSGALDDVSRRISNALAGNAPGMAALEVLGGGLRLLVNAESVRLAVACASGHFSIEDAATRYRAAPLRSVTVRRGNTLTFASPVCASVYYVAVEGGFGIEASLGSVSTYARSRLGGVGGRVLMAGDILPLARENASIGAERLLDLKLEAPRILKVVRGPNAASFPETAIELFLSSSYRVSHISDRMGLRLDGRAIRSTDPSCELEPQGTTAGAIQVPPSGQPILLLPDRQTTGGYPRIATVAGASLANAGRLAPGMSVVFEEVTRGQALSDLKAQECWLQSLPSTFETVTADAHFPGTLFANNLIGGVIDGS